MRGMVPAIPSQGSPGTASGTEGGPGELFVFWDSLGVFSERRQTKTHLLHLVVVVCRREKRSQRARGFQRLNVKPTSVGEPRTESRAATLSPGQAATFPWSVRGGQPRECWVTAGTACPEKAWEPGAARKLRLRTDVGPAMKGLGCLRKRRRKREEKVSYAQFSLDPPRSRQRGAPKRVNSSTNPALNL